MRSAPRLRRSARGGEQGLGRPARILRFGVSDLEFRLLEGNPLAAILEFVEEMEDGLVVVGSHGHGVIASVLLGSVAEGVVRKAEIPALVVPAPHRK